MRWSISDNLTLELVRLFWRMVWFDLDWLMIFSWYWMATVLQVVVFGDPRTAASSSHLISRVASRADLSTNFSWTSFFRFASKTKFWFKAVVFSWRRALNSERDCKSCSMASLFFFSLFSFKIISWLIWVWLGSSCSSSRESWEIRTEFSSRVLLSRLIKISKFAI